jgi:hypothetical protein
MFRLRKNSFELINASFFDSGRVDQFTGRFLLQTNTHASDSGHPKKAERSGIAGFTRQWRGRGFRR